MKKFTSIARKSVQAEKMIRAVLDTNIVISGLLWSGTPKHIIQAGKDGRYVSVASEEMLDELRDVIARPKFSVKLAGLGVKPDQIIAEYLKVVEIIEVEVLPETVSADSDDDMFIACAVAGNAKFIVSGDPHLLNLERYHQIQMMAASTFLAILK